MSGSFSAFQDYAKRIDHLAIAVLDLESSLQYYQSILGCSLAERRETTGKSTGMISAVLEAGSFTIVLLQGTGEDSQIAQYIREYGAGIHHVAIEVDDIEQTVNQLSEQGFEFSTDIIHGPGLDQVFSQRDKGSGMMFELIQRTSEHMFHDDNVRDLFEQLERSRLA